MMCFSGRRLLLACLWLFVASGWAFAQQSGPGPAQPQVRPGSRLTTPARPRWWKDEQFKKDLGLTSEQSARIDAIFQTTLPQLRQGYDGLERVEGKLSHLIEINADEALVTRQIDRVEATRSNLNKIRTLMQLHMRQVLTSEQRLRFTALYEKRQDEERRQRQQLPSLKHPEE